MHQYDLQQLGRTRFFQFQAKIENVNELEGSIGDDFQLTGPNNKTPFGGSMPSVTNFSGCKDVKCQ